MADDGLEQGKDDDVFSDPRGFRFQLICLNCDYATNNLKDLKVHVKTMCPYRETLPCHLLCGHCEYRAKIWPAFVRHLNHKDMQLASPCLLYTSDAADE